MRFIAGPNTANREVAELNVIGTSKTVSAYFYCLAILSMNKFPLN